MGLSCQRRSAMKNTCNATHEKHFVWKKNWKSSRSEIRRFYVRRLNSYENSWKSRPGIERGSPAPGKIRTGRNASLQGGWLLAHRSNAYCQPSLPQAPPDRTTATTSTRNRVSSYQSPFNLGVLWFPGRESRVFGGDPAAGASIFRSVCSVHGARYYDGVMCEM